MNEFIVESNFQHKGFPCVVVLRSFGYRCGYVGVKNSYTQKELEDFSVHGGITFAEKSDTYPLKSEKPAYWIGFDCAHCCDWFDYDAVKEAFRDNQKVIAMLPGFESEYKKYGRVWTREDVENECRSLVDQIIGRAER